MPAPRSPSQRIVFTIAALDDLPLPPAGTRTTYHDKREPGLQLRVTSNGRKTFCVLKRVRNGRPQRITIGLYPDLKIDQARARAIAIRNDIALGRDPAQAKRDQRAELTLGQAFNWYVEHRAIPDGLKTVDAMRANFERYLGALPPSQVKKHGLPRAKSPGSVNWEHRKLSSITPVQVAELKSSLARGAGRAAANHALKLLRVVFNCVIKARLFDGDNPAAEFGILRIKARDRFVSRDELPRLFAALAQTTNTTIRDYILLSILTGARRSNVLAMRWADIDMVRGVWRIPDTKNDEPVEVQLCDQALAVLQGRPAPGGTWVFPGTGRSGHLESPKRGVQAILDAAGIKNLRIHDLRRTLGSWQAMLGSSLVIIGKSLGHKSLAATQIYARLSAEPVRASVSQAADALYEAAQGVVPAPADEQATGQSANTGAPLRQRKEEHAAK
ncbi:tyrosine-type recombinase/integrase [Massilia cellulosiltytica]|uniref:tyrosine-type recombinase/integrase n=1 Tax=Massilia cellulosiltytica TaxID=2683234 RepID=UPI0039B4AE18